MGSKGTCLDHMRSIACGFRCLSVPFSKCMPWDFALCFSILTLESSSFLCHYFQDGCHESRILSSQPTLHARRRGQPLQYLFTFHKEAKLLMLLSRPPSQGWVTWPPPPEEAAAESFPPRVKDGLRGGKFHLISVWIFTKNDLSRQPQRCVLVAIVWCLFPFFC